MGYTVLVFCVVDRFWAVGRVVLDFACRVVVRPLAGVAEVFDFVGPVVLPFWALVREG